ncbi:MAG: hypothetical protein CM15mV2_3530 [uncultured marine virus]|nr:MAG: hypothetical protein CM15mV2_3530 [uncultured marine virus]
MCYNNEVLQSSMAKGFTVKAKSPAKKKTQAWDYDKAWELLEVSLSFFV